MTAPRFTQLAARAVVMLDADVDTDQIIPARYLKGTDKAGLADALIADWRARPDCPIGAPHSAGAQILVAGNNFGCGSSREHAAWALEDFGFRVVIAPSFGDIFHTNAIKTGLAPIVVTPSQLAELQAAVDARNELTVDLESLTITHPDGLRIEFPFDPHAQETLVHGLDDVARTMLRDAEISGFEATHPARFDTRTLV